MNAVMEEEKTYKFDELSDNAKDRARIWFLSDGLDSFHIEDTTQGLNQSASELINEVNLNWELRHDHIKIKGPKYISLVKLAAITPDVLKRHELVREHAAFMQIWNTIEVLFTLDRRDPKDLDAIIDRDSYQWESTLDVDYSDYADIDVPEDLYQQLESVTSDLTTAIHGALASEVQEQVEYYESDEYADECIQANDYEFQEDGNIA